MNYAFYYENKTYSPSPDGSENPLVPGFGIRDCSGKRDNSCGTQRSSAPRKYYAFNCAYVRRTMATNAKKIPK